MSIGTDDGAITGAVRSWNEADIWPAGIVIDATFGDATVLFLLDSDHHRGGRGTLQVTMPVTAPPPRTRFGVSAIDRARTGRTVSVTDRTAQERRYRERRRASTATAEERRKTSRR